MLKKHLETFKNKQSNKTNMAKYDVITIGSATVDAFARTDTNKILYQHHRFCYPSGTKIILSELIFTTGGGGTNTAVSFSRLGLKTAFLGRVGKYANASRVIYELKKDRVDTSLVIKGEGRTGYSIILDPKGHDRTVLTYKGSSNDLKLNQVKLSKLNTKWIYMSAMMEESYKTAAKIAEYASKKGIKIAFNPSSYLAKKGRKYLAPILSRTDIIVLNKEEAEMITQKRTVEHMLKEMRKIGPKITIITDGSKGTLAYDGKLMRIAKPHKIKVIDTTGAGDSFASAFVAGIIQGKTIEESLKMGTSNAESVISYVGAKAGLLTKKEMEKALKKKFEIKTKKI